VLSTLDRYIIKQFLGTFFFILVLVMAVAVVFDLSEKTEDLARSTATWQEVVLQYYVNFVIYYSNYFSGLLIFLAVLLFTSRMAGRTEVIASLSSGVSFPRFLRPYFIAATILTALSLYVNVFVLPDANKKRTAFEKKHIWRTYTLEDHHILREIAPGDIVYFESVDMPNRTGLRFGMEHWENGVMTRKLLSESATYDTTTGKWRIHQYTIRDIPPPPDRSTELADQDALSTAPIMRERLTRGNEMDTLIPLKPSDIGQRAGLAAGMDRKEIAAYIRSIKESGGSNAAFYEVEEEGRTAAPFATFVFTLIGVSIASRKVRGGTGVHLVLGVVLILVFIFTGKLTSVAATNSGFNPRLAVWLPNIIFGAIGVMIYRNAPK
jgi:lipopolysaccharide export system permease protein